ncbi:minor tail protein [Microbacterium phage Floof]|uniref:Minor tail protein n=1 Tax=Microbacterium phage Floof TaxID=2201433 RepID=A0A2Z4Q474_9CAUD|nr:minor tail protein [Microbacterium phage Floof]
MATFDAEFGSRPGHVLRLTLDQGTQSQAGNWTDVVWNLYLVRTSAPALTWAGDAYPWEVSLSGEVFRGASPYDFRSSSVIHIGSGIKRMGHDAGGYSTIVGYAAFNGGPLGYTRVDASMNLSRIPKPPGAPLITGSVNGIPLGPQDVKASSCMVRFSGTTDGGSAITGWEIQYAENAAFTDNPKTIASNGQTTITGLKAGTTYYFRARGRNGVGWGAYSVTVSARTIAALYFSNGTSWLPAEVYVSDGTSWSPAEVLISDGTTWSPAG